MWLLRWERIVGIGVGYDGSSDKNNVGDLKERDLGGEIFRVLCRNFWVGR